jgi:uncharacterized coiled-coil protein SlyX
MKENMLNQAASPEQFRQQDPYRVTWLEQRIGILEGKEQDLLKRIVNLEQQVANQAVAMEKINVRVPVIGYSDVLVKSQAAQQQAQGSNYMLDQIEAQEKNLYAPLRSDTKPLLEMAAFVRKVANVFFKDTDKFLGAATELEDLAYEAQEILKRST